MVADRLCLEGLRNRVVDLMADLADSTNSVLTPSDTRILYDLLPENAPIRRLVLDLFAFKKTDKLLEEHEDRWHAAFLRDLCVLLKRPCRQALLRHRLVMWFPPSVGHWKGVLACDHCRNVLEKRRGAVRCEECGVGWCGRCVGEGVGMATWEDGNVGRVGRATRWSVGGSAGSSGDEGNVWEDAASTAVSEGGSSGGSGSARGVKKVRFRKWQSCKPWRGARCAIYHEHRETARCEDVLMGLAGNVS